MEFALDHQFSGSIDKQEAIRLVVDGATEVHDKAGYWMNMATFGKFKNDHGPLEAMSDSDEDRDGDGFSSNLLELAKEAKIDGAGGKGSRSLFWKEFIFTGQPLRHSFMSHQIWLRPPSQTFIPVTSNTAQASLSNMHSCHVKYSSGQPLKHSFLSHHI
jgi:hypothetical protein